MIDLDARRVLITGASRGIGAACAELFAQAGATVLAHYAERRDATEQLLRSLPQPSSGTHLSFPANVADPSQVEALFDYVRREFGGLDCLVNNAGIWVRNPLAELDREKLEQTWRVNELGPFLCASHAAPLLVSAKDGNIVNLSSTAGQRGEAFYSPYAASKGAMIAATKSWSSELAPRVRVNAVAPGWVDTEMCVEPFADGGREAIVASIPLGRVATAVDIAGAVLFLASGLARHVTGEVLNVNGGSVLSG